MERYLFIYGTLSPRHAPAEISGAVRRLRRVGKGSVQGKLYDLGEYPGAVLSKSGNAISGEVFALPEDGELLSSLDNYEGFDPRRRRSSLFIRKAWPVTMSDGNRLRAWVYVYNGDLAKAAVIRSGRFRPGRSVPRKRQPSKH